MSLPPLVEPGDELSASEAERYSRHLLVPRIGAVGQRRLKAARVLVIGAGGLGAPALTYLAAAGVGTIGVVDDDLVELSNLQRQVIHRTADVGRAKTESAADAVAAVNPDVRLVQHRLRLDEQNADAIVSGYDLVLDGADNFPTRYLVNDACARAGKPYVWGSILQFAGQVSVFWSTHGPQYRDVYPHPPPEGSVPSCAQAGVLGALCATIGSVMVTEAVKLICGVGQTLLGRLLVYDALDLTFRTVAVRPDPSRAAAAPDRDGGPAMAPGGDVAGVTAGGRAELAGHTVSASELRRRIQAGQDLLLIDVREPAERDIAVIDGSVGVPLAGILSGAALADLPRDRRLVLHCHSGGRSATALRALLAAGFDAEHLDGGILAWIDQVDPTLARY